MHRITFPERNAPAFPRVPGTESRTGKPPNVSIEPRNLFSAAPGTFQLLKRQFNRRKFGAAGVSPLVCATPDRNAKNVTNLADKFQVVGVVMLC
jgi:hypothetical protein